MYRKISAKEREQGNIITAVVVFWNPVLAAVWCPLHCGQLHPHLPTVSATGIHSFRYPDKLVVEKAPCDPEGFKYAVVFPFENHSAVQELGFIIHKLMARFETTGLDIPELRDGHHKHFVGFRDKDDSEDEDELEDMAEAKQEGEVEEQVDTFGNTTLLLAVKRGDVDLVKLALASGSNIDAQNLAGETSLILASKSGNISLVSLLVQKGAEKGFYDSAGNSALSYAQKHPRIRAYLTGKVELPLEDQAYCMNNLENITFHRQSTSALSSSKGTLTTIGPVMSIKVGWGVREKTLAVLDRQSPFPTIFALSGSTTHRDIDKRLSNALLLNGDYYTGRVFELSDIIGHEIEKSDFGPRKTRFDNENGREARILFACHAEKKAMCFTVDHHCFLRSDLKKKELRDLEQISPPPEYMLREANIRLSHRRICRCCLDFKQKLEEETDIGYGKFEFKINLSPQKYKVDLPPVSTSSKAFSTPQTPQNTRNEVQKIRALTASSSNLIENQSQVELMGNVSLTLTPETVRFQYPEYTAPTLNLPRTPSPRPRQSRYLPTPSTLDSASCNDSSLSDASPLLSKRRRLVSRSELNKDTDSESETMTFASITDTFVVKRKRTELRTGEIRRRLSYGSREEEREPAEVAMKSAVEVIDLTGDD